MDGAKVEQNWLQRAGRLVERGQSIWGPDLQETPHAA